MKRFVVTATLVAVLGLGMASSADAQYRSQSYNSLHGSALYSNPSRSNQTHFNSTHGATGRNFSGYNSLSGYNGVVGVGSFVPQGGTPLLIGGGSSFYTPRYNSFNSFPSSRSSSFGSSSFGVTPGFAQNPNWPR